MGQGYKKDWIDYTWAPHMKIKQVLERGIHTHTHTQVNNLYNAHACKNMDLDGGDDDGKFENTVKDKINHKK